jgi:hypothetical protein
MTRVSGTRHVPAWADSAVNFDTESVAILPTERRKATGGNGPGCVWAARDSNPARRIKSPFVWTIRRYSTVGVGARLCRSQGEIALRNAQRPLA